MQHPNIQVVGTGELALGQRVSIGPDVQIVFHKPGRVTIGDYCSIGQGVKFVCDGGDVTLGDWTTLHDRCLVLSGKGLHVGQHAWFGQHCVLDGTGGLTVGNGVRVGMYSQIWSHVAAGEQIEGCTLFGTRPVVIEDDVWLVGSCIVASGVTVGRRTVALIASNITKSWPENSVLAGSPAMLKEKLTFYRPITADEQWMMLTGWLSEVSASLGLECIRSGTEIVYRWSEPVRAATIAFVATTDKVPSMLASYPDATVCCLESKSYIKRLTELEHRVLKFLSGNKARFIDAGQLATTSPPEAHEQH